MVDPSKKVPYLKCEVQDLLLEVVDLKQEVPDLRSDPPRNLTPVSTPVWLSSRVVSVLDSGAEGPEFKSQSRRCRVTVLDKLFTPIVPLFIKQQNW